MECHSQHCMLSELDEFTYRDYADRVSLDPQSLMKSLLVENFEVPELAQG